MTYFDWLSRVVMLVLAGLVSLSIIGAIAAIPSGTIESRIGMEQADPQPREAGQPRQDRPEPTARPEQRAASAGQPGGMVAAASDDQDGLARWLESITYALLALIGLAALATLILWRTLHERRRIADALELLAEQRR